MSFCRSTTIATIVRLAHEKGAIVYVDDAGGARVGPAAFDQPRMLELGVDVGATGLDKYGTVGPRFGLLAGRKDLVDLIRAKGFEFGLECRQMLYPAIVRTLENYSPQRVRDLIASTKQVGAELRPLIGNRMAETPTTVQISADDILQIAMERGDVTKAPIVPFEATAALCMLLLRDHNMLTVHFVGVPPGGADLLIKFLPPETLKHVRRSEEVCPGARRFAEQARRRCCASRKVSGSCCSARSKRRLAAREAGSSKGGVDETGSAQGLWLRTDIRCYLLRAAVFLVASLGTATRAGALAAR